jgi:hypothetical protein
MTVTQEYGAAYSQRFISKKGRDLWKPGAISAGRLGHEGPSLKKYRLCLLLAVILLKGVLLR